MDLITGMLISAGINAAMGAAKSAQAAKQRQSEANIRAAEIEAAPWTNKEASTQIATKSPSLWADMLGGAISGVGQAQAFQKAGLFGSTPDVSSTAIKESPYTLMYKQQNRSFLNPWETE